MEQKLSIPMYQQFLYFTLNFAYFPGGFTQPEIL